MDVQTTAGLLSYSHRKHTQTMLSKLQWDPRARYVLKRYVLFFSPEIMNQSLGSLSFQFRLIDNLGKVHFCVIQLRFNSKRATLLLWFKSPWLLFSLFYANHFYLRWHSKATNRVVVRKGIDRYPVIPFMCRKRGHWGAHLHVAWRLTNPISPYKVNKGVASVLHIFGIR